MDVLLVNNDSDTWDELQQVAKAAGYSVTAIHHNDISTINPSDYDLAILSGGWYYDDETELLRQYADELQLINSTPLPIIGICVGMQLMHIAIDQAVPLLGEREFGKKPINVNEAGQKLFGFPSQIEVFKNHDRAVKETDPQFEILATSPGYTEIMRHRTKALLGVQFHPEVGNIDECVTLLKTLVNAVVNDKS